MKTIQANKTGKSAWGSGNIIKIERPLTREAWLDLRQKYVGASEIGALFGVHDYTSAFKLQCRKLNMLDDDAIKENVSMRRGRLMEPVNIQCVREERPNWQLNPNNEFPIHLYVDNKARICCTPDIQAIDENGRPGNVQCKSIERSIFKKKWFVDGVLQVPLWIGIQAAIEAHMTGAQWAAVSALVVSHGVECYIEKIPLGDVHELYARACEQAAIFWEKTDRHELFDPDFALDSNLIKALYPKSEPNKVVDLSNDNRIAAMAAEYAIASKMHRDAEKKKDAIKAELRTKMKDAEIAVANGHIVATAKMVHRKGFIVKETDYRNLRFYE